jgi:hypothetical protein
MPLIYNIQLVSCLNVQLYLHSQLEFFFLKAHLFLHVRRSRYKHSWGISWGFVFYLFMLFYLFIFLII